MVTWDEWRAGATHIEVGGLDVATYDLGPADAPTYTFCHGYPSASLDIAEVAAQLDGLAAPRSRHPRVRGVGQAAGRPGGHTLLDPRCGRCRRGTVGGQAGRRAPCSWRTTTACRWPRSCWPAGPAARSAEASHRSTGVVWMNGGPLPRPAPTDAPASRCCSTPITAPRSRPRSTRRRSSTVCGARGAAAPVRRGGGARDLPVDGRRRRRAADARPAALRGRPAAPTPTGGDPRSRATDLPMVFVWG